MPRPTAEMDVERTKGGRPAPVVIGHALGGVKGEFVRPPDLEGREGQPLVEGRARSKRRQRNVGVADGRLAGRRSPGPRSPPGSGDLGAALAEGTHSVRLIFCRLERRGTAHEYEDLHHRAEFGVERHDVKFPEGFLN